MSVCACIRRAWELTLDIFAGNCGTANFLGFMGRSTLTRATGPENNTLRKIWRVATCDSRPNCDLLPSNPPPQLRVAKGVIPGNLAADHVAADLQITVSGKTGATAHVMEPTDVAGMRRWRSSRRPSDWLGDIGCDPWSIW